MAFVNENISEDDRQKYNIDRFDEEFVVGGTRSSQWTIDRERNIYFKNVVRGREENSGASKWILYVDEVAFIVSIENISTEKINGSHKHSIKKLKGVKVLDGAGNPYGDAYILDLIKEVLIAYREFGMFSKSKTYSLELIL